MVIQLPEINENELISYYTTGLSKHVAFDIIRQADLQVRLLKTRCTLDDYMLIAEQYENASSSHIRHEVNKPDDPHGVQPMDLNYIQYRGNPQSIRRKFENKNRDYDQNQHQNNEYQNRYNHWYQNKNTRFDQYKNRKKDDRKHSSQDRNKDSKKHDTKNKNTKKHWNNAEIQTANNDLEDEMSSTSQDSPSAGDSSSSDSESDDQCQSQGN